MEHLKIQKKNVCMCVISVCVCGVRESVAAVVCKVCVRVLYVHVVQ